MMLAVYTFVFGTVLGARWPQSGGQQGLANVALILFAGLIPFNLFAECLGRAPRLVVDNANYVKKVVFPLEILPWVAVLSALFHALVSLAVLLLFQWYLTGYVPYTAPLVILVWIPLLLLCLGAGWWLSALGVYLRDVAQLVGMMVTILMFMSPLFYPASSLPIWLRDWLWLNPLISIIETSRTVLLWGGLPDWQGLFVQVVLAGVFALTGLYWFQRTRKGFADVL